MTEKHYKLINNDVKRNMVAYVAELPLEPLMECVIREYVSKRSEQQNRAYFGVWLPAIRQHAMDSGYGENSVDEWHEFFRQRYVPEKASIVFGEVVPFRKSTAKLGVKGFMSYCKNIEEWCYENLGGFVLPELITKDYE